FWCFFDLGDSRVKSRVESPVNRVVSRPATCHNVIAGRRRTPFLNVLKTGCRRSRKTGFQHVQEGGDVCIGLFWSTRSDVKMVYRFPSVGFF
ncbi:hypothetical protein L1D06_26770, partial [Klebsiella pneumoniae]|uniref:hypothetical protein n=1 Tax=Klebsiella pneumoniae TaxID=573 RepID=UPI0020CC42DF